MVLARRRSVHFRFGAGLATMLTRQTLFFAGYVELGLRADRPETDLRATRCRLWFPIEHDDLCRHVAHDPLCLYAGRDEFGTFILARPRVGMVHIQRVEAAFTWERARL